MKSEIGFQSNSNFHPKFIFLQTLQHTGTWFLIQFLTSHPDVIGFQEIHKVKTLNMEEKFPSYPDKTLVKPGIKIVDRNNIGVNLLHTHLTSPDSSLQYFSINNILTLVSPFVFLIRDPLLAMLSHKERSKRSRDSKAEHEAPFNSRLPIILRVWDYFIAVAEEFKNKEISEVVYVPLDLYEEKDSLIHQHNIGVAREMLLRSILAAYNLDIYYEFVRDYATRWPRFNVLKNNTDKAFYYKGQKAILKDLHPEIFQELKIYQERWRPFFESLGYKDLLWWD